MKMRADHQVLAPNSRARPNPLTHCPLPGVLSSTNAAPPYSGYSLLTGQDLDLQSSPLRAHTLSDTPMPV